MNTSTHIQTASAPPGSLHAVVVPIRETFTRPSVEQTETKTHNDALANRLLSVAVSGRPVPDEDGNALLTSRKSSIKTERGGKLYNIPESQLAKAQAHWARKTAQRKQPGNCGRCGKPNPQQTHKHCPACRDYQKRYKLGLMARGHDMTQAAVIALVKQCRREVSKLREIIKKMQKENRRKYNQAWMMKRTLRKYADAYPEISKQELATMSHAYDTEDAR